SRHDLLGVTKAVDGRRVDPVDAGVQRLADGGDGVPVVLGAPGEFPARAPDGPGAEADRGDEQGRRSQPFRVHDFSSLLLDDVPFKNVAGRQRSSGLAPITSSSTWSLDSELMSRAPPSATSSGRDTVVAPWVASAAARAGVRSQTRTE